MLMNQFIQDIRTRFGDAAALVCEMWINFYLHREESEAYVKLVKLQMATLIQHTGVDAKLFNKLVEESNTFLQKFEQTIH